MSRNRENKSEERLTFLIGEIEKINRKYEHASSEDIKDDLWVIRDRLETELTQIRASAPKLKASPLSRLLAGIGRIEKWAVGACFLLFLAISLDVLGGEAEATAVSGYKLFSTAHLVLFGVSILLALLALCRALLRKRDEISRLLRAVKREFERDIE